MKFLCDRCKTRYAIADERVRGKILKIRCKNCSAVITVREGMDEQAEPTAAAEAPPAPPPPPALDEEWYVSRDGAQEGPFALTEAQAWIAARGPDDELFCWNEGFDDWLPVEKVSHFRGLRGGAPTRTRAQTRPGAVKEPEPQPLFAATLAAIEAEAAADAAKPTAPQVSQLPAAKTAPASPWIAPVTELTAPPPAAADETPAPRPGTPAVGVPAGPVAAGARGGTPSTGVPALPRAGTAPGLPKLQPASSPFGLAPSVQKPNPFAARPGTTPPPTAAGPAAMNLAAAAATNAVTMGAANATAAAAPPPTPEAGPQPAPAAPPPTPIAAVPPPTPAPPIARPAAARFDTGDAESAGASAALVDEVGPPPPSPDAFSDDLEIGEVSRVVRLADLGRPGNNGRAAPAKPRAPTASFAAIGRGTGAVSSLPAPAAASAPSADEPALPLDLGASMHVAPARRRGPGLYIGLGLAAVAIAVVAVVALNSGGGDDASGNETTRGTADYGDLGYRPTDPTAKRPLDPGAGTASGSQARVPDRTPGSGRKPVGSGSQQATGSNGGTGAGTGTGSATEVGNPGLPELSADDVFAMSSRMESGTRRCYERAMKEDPFLKVSKIKATIAVSAAGPVSSVTLSSMANTPLGNCLVAAIKRWPFKPSKDGIVSEFALVFEQK